MTLSSLAPYFDETSWNYIHRVVCHRWDNECWVWPFGLNKGSGSKWRYGFLYALRAIDLKHRQILAHKMSFFLRNGHWPEPHGLHECDNTACFNPEHVFSGTLKDNTQDMMRKGRNRYVLPPHRRGEQVNSAKLTAKAVIEIRQCYVPRKVSQYKLAHEYGVEQSVISMVVIPKNLEAYLKLK